VGTVISHVTSWLRNECWLFSIGRALLELQALLPYCNTFCVNKEGYAFMQSSTRADLAKVALHYSIPILCNSMPAQPKHHHGVHKAHLEHVNRSVDEHGPCRRRPILPTISLIPGIQKAQLNYPPESMQLIISQHSLNEGLLFRNMYVCVCIMTIYLHNLMYNM
jgi:hypothetical protein